jgi:hypothetical protein
LAPSYGYGKVITAARAGDALAFMTALQNSSWSAGHYNYSKLTGALGSALEYNTALTLRAPSGSGITPVSSIGTGTLTASGDRPAEEFSLWQQHLRSIGINSAPDYVLTHDDAIAIVSKLYKMNVAGNEENSIIKGMIASWEGKTVTEAWGGGKAQTIGPDPLGAAGDAIGSVMDVGEFLGGIGAFLFDTDNWKYIGALAIGIPMTLLGFYLLAGVPTGGANA